MSKYAFVNAIVLDGTLNEKGKMLPQEKNILVENARIIAIQNRDIKISSDFEVIDLTGKYILPGLINLHVHLPLSGGIARKRSKPVDYKKLFEILSKVQFIMNSYRILQARNMVSAVYSGVTTLRTTGGILNFDAQIRDEIEAGKRIGPRMLVSNMAVSVVGGHFAGSIATEAKTPEAAARDVRNIAATKPDWIKLMVTGGVMDASETGEPGVLRMKPEIIKSACDEAHNLGYRVAAHVESPEGIRVALENGVDTIEHGAKPTPELIRLFKEKNAADICTISPTMFVNCAEENHGITEGQIIVNGKHVQNGIVECAKKCIAAGIPVGLGGDTGCPYVPHYDFWRELVYFKNYCDVSRDFALHTATQRNAEILGIDGQTGTVEIGKSADLLVTGKNPLQTLEALRQPEMVCCRGKLYRTPKIRRNKKVDAELDALKLEF